MSFRLAPHPTFTGPVTVSIANDKGGFDKSTFTAKFTRPAASELPEARLMQHEDLVRKYLVGWKMEDTDTKEDVPFTPDNMEAALQITPTAMCIAQAFWEGANGARVKNF